MTIRDLQKKYKLTANDFWQLKRSGKEIWIITHDACEKIAAKEKIETEKIEMINSGWDFCRMIITMKKGEKREISIGEALLNTDIEIRKGKYGPVMKGNCESQYIGAMAEKRGKDRCVLKLINAYEYGIYSDSEADDFARSKNNSVETKATNNVTAEKLWELAKKGLVRCSECGEHIFYEEYKVGEKAGQPKPLKCKYWQHKGLTVKKEKDEVAPF